MNSVIFFACGFIFCLTLQAMQRSKLKGRYCFAILSAVIVIVTVSCELPIDTFLVHTNIIIKDDHQMELDCDNLKKLREHMSINQRNVFDKLCHVTSTSSRKNSKRVNIQVKNVNNIISDHKAISINMSYSSLSTSTTEYNRVASLYPRNHTIRASNDTSLLADLDEEPSIRTKTEQSNLESLVDSPIKPSIYIRHKARHLNKENMPIQDTTLFGQMNINKDLLNYFSNDNDSTAMLPHRNPQAMDKEIKNRLPWWEIIELENYSRVWFFGKDVNKTVYNQSDPLNHGFDYMKEADDSESRLKIVKGDHLAYRYEIIRKLGSGSYGTVVHARDHALPDDHVHHWVAIKVMHNDSSVQKYFKKEMNMMKLIKTVTKSPDRFSTIVRTFYFRNHFCIVFELLGDTLDDAHDGPILDMQVLRKYAKDILAGVVDLHKANIIHGDLKPENLMLVRGCNLSCSILVKIADFNLACVQNSTDHACPGRYFQTRFYRAPEVILDNKYDATADMWSVGVILVELFLDKVPFYGETSTDQLAAIMEVVGLLPPYMVKESPRIHTYQKAVCYKCENGFERSPYRKSLTSMLNDAPPTLFDFIKRCLELDPRKRMTSFQALHHPFIKGRKKIGLRQIIPNMQ